MFSTFSRAHYYSVFPNRHAGELSLRRRARPWLSTLQKWHISYCLSVGKTSEDYQIVHRLEKKQRCITQGDCKSHVRSWNRKKTLVGKMQRNLTMSAVERQEVEFMLARRGLSFGSWWAVASQNMNRRRLCQHSIRMDGWVSVSHSSQVSAYQKQPLERLYSNVGF